MTVESAGETSLISKTLSRLFSLFILSSLLLGNQVYFTTVQRTAKAYRVMVSKDDMRMVQDPDGGQSFHLMLKSNRNNFEMVMLVGYIAAGEAMKTGLKPARIFVSVDVPVDEGIRLDTMATRENISRLLSGEIDTVQFSRLISYI